MDRRALLALTAVSGAALAAGPALAGDKKAPEGAPVLNVAGVGLPVIEDGRIRNYVFVAIRLHLGGGKTVEQMRLKEPYIRDAVVKAAHRTPFIVPGDWTRLNERALAAAIVRAGVAAGGRGAVTRAEIVSQTPRRRTGVRAGG